jgi:hypothetical protein
VNLAMSERHAFGSNLRRIRVQRGISIDQIVAATHVSARLWEALERNDLSNWPNGIYARAYVRGYAKIVGAEVVIRGQAEIVGHTDLQWRDHVPPVLGDVDRRAGAATATATPQRKAQTMPAAAFSQVFGRLRALLRA